MPYSSLLSTPSLGVGSTVHDPVQRSIRVFLVPPGQKWLQAKPEATQLPAAGQDTPVKTASSLPKGVFGDLLVQVVPFQNSASGNCSAFFQYEPTAMHEDAEAQDTPFRTAEPASGRTPERLTSHAVPFQRSASGQRPPPSSWYQPTP